MRLVRLIPAVVIFAAGAASAQQQYSAVNIQAGLRVYTENCGTCHGGTGDGIAGVNLPRQQFRRASTDADIRNTVTNGVPAAGMPPFQFRPEELNAVIAYIRSGFDTSGVPFNVGDATRGKAVYDVKGGCAACHRLHGNGGRTAPDLSDIGAIRKPAAIQLAILDPNTAMQPINRLVTITTRDGRSIVGRRLNEDTESVQLIDRNARLVSLPKSDITRYDIAKTAEMPSYAGKLSGGEVADLLAYLISLRG